MEKQQFNISINAPANRVWEVLWGSDTYPAWTSVFSEGSRAETDGWKKGTKVLFLDGKGSGMVSKVAENIPMKLMTFQHLGIVKEGKEDTESEEVKDWAGALESYSLEESGGQTDLVVEIDIAESFKEYFDTTFPKALHKVKTLSEAGE